MSVSALLLGGGDSPPPCGVLELGSLNDVSWWWSMRRCPGAATFQSREDRKAYVYPPPGGCPRQPECPLARRLSEQTQAGKKEGPK